jgi:hypothetical protein
MLMLACNSLHAQLSITELSKYTEGVWKGEGFQMTEEGKRIEFMHTEVVRPELDGRLITFNGVGKGKGSENGGFKAYGVMYTDPDSGKARMHAWTNDGRYTNADVTFGESSFYWEFKVPDGGTVRYSTEFSGSNWSEKGQYSPPNSDAWYPFLSMNLEKVDN